MDTADRDTTEDFPSTWSLVAFADQGRRPPLASRAGRAIVLTTAVSSPRASITAKLAMPKPVVDWISVHTLPERGLSNPNFRDTYPALANRSFPALRLMGTIIVALLAMTMAIFPISGLQAAAQAAHRHASVADAGHAHLAADADHEHAETRVSLDAAVSVSGDHDHPDSKDCTGLTCCSMGACHAFQITALPSLYSPAVSEASIVLTRDEQVEEITAGGLDRPPRTI
jgi:hypothetical protein